MAENEGNPTPETETTQTGESTQAPEKKEESYTKDTVSKIVEREVGKALKKKDAEILQLTNQIEEFKGKDLGELEKLQKKLEKANQVLAEKDTELTGTRLELTKTKALLRAGAPPEKVDSLLKRVAGTSEEEISADVQELVALGWIGNAPEAESKPAANGSGKPPVKDSIKKFTKAQLAAMSPEDYSANRADIMAAMESGQIT